MEVDAALNEKEARVVWFNPMSQRIDILRNLKGQDQEVAELLQPIADAVASCDRRGGCRRW